MFEMEDFETDIGFCPIHINDLKKLLHYYPYGHEYRIYLILLMISAGRPGEIEDLNWIKNFTESMIIYKPHKQEKLCKSGKVPIRRITIPPMIMQELNYFKNNNFFKDGRLFNFQYKSLSKYFNSIIRADLRGKWIEMCPFSRGGSVQKYHRYTLRGIRTTIGTIVFDFFRRKYGDTVALARTCMWMGHNSERITADHYIKHVDKIGLEDIPKFSSPLQIMDYVMYTDVQTKIEDFKIRQQKLVEIGKSILICDTNLV